MQVDAMLDAQHQVLNKASFTTPHALKVIEVDRSIAGNLVVTLAVPPDLRKVFRYRAGQYVTLMVEIVGKPYRRPYSLASHPEDDELLRIAIKVVPGGIVSGSLYDQIQRGDSVKVLPPAGEFFHAKHLQAKQRCVLVAAGSGITPIISIAREVLKNQPSKSVLLVYSNRSRATTLFHSELVQLQRRYPQRLKIVHYFTQEGFNLKTFLRPPWRLKELVVYRRRLLPTELLALIDQEWPGIKPADCAFYLCGPQAMTGGLMDELTKYSCAPKDIHIEHFCANDQSVATNAKVGSSSAAKAPISCLVKLNIAEQEMSLNVMSDESILDAAERKNIDLPYSCRSAVCSVCVAQLVSGKVDMIMNNILTDDDIQAGKIIMCQARPASEQVVIRYV